MNRPDSVLIVVPTFNERDNIRLLANQLRAIVPQADILFVDDDSPDGTGSLADDLADDCPAIHVLHRSGKKGLGRAYVAGLQWGLARHYAAFVQMDADLSHDPNAVPHLLSRLETADLALGSRYVQGGDSPNREGGRRVLSRFGNLYARYALGITYRDLTGGFKCWRREALAAIDLATVASNGYSFQIETTCRAARQGFRIVEEPIVFRERACGRSKMSPGIVREAVGIVWRLRRVRFTSGCKTYDSAAGSEAST